MNSGDDRMKLLAENMKALRVRTNLTQAELGDVFGLNYRTISSYENSTLCPGVDIIFRYCDFFDIRPDDLMGYKHFDSDQRKMIVTNVREVSILEGFRFAPDWVKEVVDITLKRASEHHKAVRKGLNFIDCSAQLNEDAPSYSSEGENQEHEGD